MQNIISAQIIAGLKKHISSKDLIGRLVVAITNLKTAKLAGEISEGMILAAVTKGSQYDNGELVYPLDPPGKLVVSIQILSTRVCPRLECCNLLGSPLYSLEEHLCLGHKNRGRLEETYAFVL